MVNLPTTRVKVTLLCRMTKDAPAAMYRTYVRHIAGEFSLKDLLGLIDRLKRQVHVPSRSYARA
ncbi:hypothetical protein WN48_00356 [Eufriesea mexicana]|uniref:Uncharacterized protein n=1 Tax=Eufriesea mexicana TaxID=516756 RepID=A0A310SGN5_9HYME|nr:hypothetical protein WN48_00356 [Eufriesea mexicana]